MSKAETPHETEGLIRLHQRQRSKIGRCLSKHRPAGIVGALVLTAAGTLTACTSSSPSSSSGHSSSYTDGYNFGLDYWADSSALAVSTCTRDASANVGDMPVGEDPGDWIHGCEDAMTRPRTTAPTVPVTSNQPKVVPTVAGMTIQQAENSLGDIYNHGCTYQPSQTVPPGDVIGTDPPAGTPLTDLPYEFGCTGCKYVNLIVSGQTRASDICS